MTISSTTIKNSYAGNGSTTAFTFSYYIIAEDDLEVFIRASNGTETLQTITTDYTVTGVQSNSGGTVTMVTAPATGETLVIRRKTSQVQDTDYVANDPFPAETHEAALDKAMLVSQELQEAVDRSIKISRTNTMTSTDFTVGATERANKVLAFDSSGEISVTQELGRYRGDWSASTSYAVRDLVKDTSTNNIFFCNAAHTSSGIEPLTTNSDSAKWDLIVDAASATTSANAAASSATAAAASATASANSATSSASSATDAQTAQTAAETAQTAAETAKTAAETAETNAETSETNAATSATTASTQATNASNSATASASSATASANSASAASTSETNASTSETNASNSATAAATSETNAATSASNASTSETNASNSATTATTQATNSANSATASATSATNASNSATAAATSAASAAAAYDTFDDRYLGSKTSNPTVDNDGNALVTGALYFNSSANEMRVFDGGNWIAASSAGTASLILYEYTATAGQTTFTGSDDNSATLSYSVSNIIVTLNGITLDPDDYTATSGTSIVLGSAAALNDILNVYAFKSFTVSELNANNLNDGIIPDARFPATLPAISGANLTNLDASDLASGTIPDARFPATLPAIDGSALTGIESGIAWQSSIKTSNFTASSNEGYWVDTSSNTVTITFPSNPSVGDTIELVDYARNWGSNKIIIDSNGKNYQGDPDTFTVEYDTSGQGLRVVYSGTTKGWIPTSDEVSEDNPVDPNYNVDFLVIAGGGGGGQDSGGGGGAGGYRASYNSEASGGGGSSESALSVAVGTQYTITVGGGGTGSQNPGFPNAYPRGTSGSNSVFGTITSIGGGAGGVNTESPVDLRPGLTGGSGGGAGVNSNGGTITGAAGTSNQGFAGGNAEGGAYPARKGGGGGGASAVGGNASTSVAGSGGNGVASTITGSSVTRAGGGGGSGQDNNGTAGSGGSGGGGAGSVSGTGTSATTNTGGGGGGSAAFNNAGNGGSGIVILRMPTASYTGTTTGSPSVTTDGSDTILTYTGSGSYTA